MDRIEFAKRCMEHSDPYYICSGSDVYTRCFTCPYGISLAKDETVCSNHSRKAWAKKVLAEQTQKELEEIRKFSNTTGATLYPPSTFTAAPALAEPVEEEDYEEEKEKTVRFESPIHPEDVVTLQVGKGILPEDMEWKDALLFEKERAPAFEPRTRGGHEYEIYKIRTDGDKAPIHGAIKAMNGEWFAHCWTINGFSFYDNSPDNCDLVLAKKRRFKTAEELVAEEYGLVTFNVNKTITVTQFGHTFHRTKSDTPEGNYTKEWLDVFTTLSEEET